MNELFVNIKVDREERPDVDAIYMGALHELGEQGGWPLTMFLTSDAEPFWGGTYFPKDARYGRPAFVRVLNEVARIYRDEQDKVRQNADVLKDRLKPRAAARRRRAADRGDARRSRAAPGAGGRSDAWRHQGRAEISAAAVLRTAVARGPPLRRSPNPLEAVDLTLTQIAQGGIYDHLGGGFARYSVDERWLVPHFEKMLYDNAQLDRADDRGLARAEVAALCAAHRRDHRLALARDGRSRAAGSPSSLDADSEGEEGKFYVWSLAEIEDVLGEADAGVFAEIYDVTAQGNFEGHNILNRLDAIELRDAETEARLAAMRGEAARAARAARPPRLRRQGARRLERADDRSARQRGGRVRARRLARSRGARLRLRQYTDEFERAAAARLSRRRGQGAGDRQRLRQHDQGGARARQRHRQAATISSARTRGSTCSTSIIGRTISAAIISPPTTPSDLIVRPFSGQDEATPNANGVMVSNLMALYLWTGEERYRERAEAILRGFAGAMAENVLAHAGLARGRARSRWRRR